jgi:hypothetical protein
MRGATIKILLKVKILKLVFKVCFLCFNNGFVVIIKLAEKKFGI